MFLPFQLLSVRFSFFFFNDTATTEIYTLSLHDALPIFLGMHLGMPPGLASVLMQAQAFFTIIFAAVALGERPSSRQIVGLRSEEHTSELQSRQYLVCRLLLEKKKTARPSR